MRQFAYLPLARGRALRTTYPPYLSRPVEAFWYNSTLYTQNAYGTLPISKLNPDMYGSGTEYLYGTERDFFYLTRFTPPSV